MDYRLDIFHEIVDRAHAFQVKLDVFDKKIEKQEFFDAKHILSELEQLLMFLFNPSYTGVKQKYECDSDEFKDIIEEFAKNIDDSKLPGICLFQFAESYNKRALQFQEKLLNHTLSQFKSAFSNSKIDIDKLRQLILIGNSNYQSKFIIGLEKLFTSQLSITVSKGETLKVNSEKSKDLNKCKIKQALGIIDILTQLRLDSSKQLVYYVFHIICKNMISEFDYLEARDVMDKYLSINLHFDPKIEFVKIANEEMSLQYINIASHFFDANQGFSTPIEFDCESFKFSGFINNLIAECNGLLDYELNMRVKMIMACICSYSASFGKIIEENKNDINKLLHVFINLILVKREIWKVVMKDPFKPIITSLDFSQSIAEIALKAILGKVNHEIESEPDNGYIITEEIITRLSKYPFLPEFNRLFNFIIDIAHFNLIRFIYKSLENADDIDEILAKCQGIMDAISKNKPPLVHKDSELRAKSRLLIKVLDNRNVDILDFTGSFFSDSEVSHLRSIIY